MDTDLILRLAKHPNIAGVKHTDHDIGKIAREAAVKDIGCRSTSLQLDYQQLTGRSPFHYFGRCHRLPPRRPRGRR
jgi:dihydrodipicolinate synthase/N-acetylneuraminate lyase